MRFSAQFFSHYLKSLWLLLAWVPGVSQAEQPWSLLTSMSYNRGYYVYEEAIENYYVNVGVRYRAPKWTISATLPFLAQRDNVQITSLLETATPENSFEVPTDGATDPDINLGLGDLYILGERTLWKGHKNRSAIAITAQLKIPSGLSNQTFSSNVLDFGGGLTFRRSFGVYNAFADIGYLMLGDPEGITYQDPMNYGIGLGRFFVRGKVSASLYYKAYTQIFDGIIPPKQVSLGVFSRISYQTYISMYFTRGLSESSPDYALSIGFTQGM